MDFDVHISAELAPLVVRADLADNAGVWISLVLDVRTQQAATSRSSCRPGGDTSTAKCLRAPSLFWDHKKTRDARRCCEKRQRHSSRAGYPVPCRLLLRARATSCARTSYHRPGYGHRCCLGVCLPCCKLLFAACTSCGPHRSVAAEVCAVEFCERAFSHSTRLTVVGRALRGCRLRHTCARSGGAASSRRHASISRSVCPRGLGLLRACTLRSSCVFSLQILSTPPT